MTSSAPTRHGAGRGGAAWRRALRDRYSFTGDVITGAAAGLPAELATQPLIITTTAAATMAQRSGSAQERTGALSTATPTILQPTRSVPTEHPIMPLMLCGASASRGRQSAAAGRCAACHAVRMLAHQLLLITTDHLMAAGILQTLRRAVVAFLAMVFAVGLLAGGTLGFFLGRAAGRRE
jgi:hypothetical protein